METGIKTHLIFIIPSLALSHVIRSCVPSEAESAGPLIPAVIKLTQRERGHVFAADIAFFLFLDEKVLSSDSRPNAYPARLNIYFPVETKCK